MIVIQRKTFNGGIIKHLLTDGIAAVSVRAQQKQNTSKMNAKIASLNEHIIDNVANFENVGKPFSAHDITLSLRESLNSKLIELNDRPFEQVSTRNSGSVYSQKLEHAEVRDLVHSMYDQGDFPNIEQDRSGGFIVYRSKQSSAVVPAPATSAGTVGGINMVAAPAYTSGNGPKMPVTYPITSVAAVATFPKLDSYAQSSAPATLFRLKYDGKFLSNRKGRTAFKRRSDLTQAFRKLRPELEQAIQAGKAEIVSV